MNPIPWEPSDHKLAARRAWIKRRMLYGPNGMRPNNKPLLPEGEGFDDYLSTCKHESFVLGEGYVIEGGKVRLSEEYLIYWEGRTVEYEDKKGKKRQYTVFEVLYLTLIFEGDQVTCQFRHDPSLQVWTLTDAPELEIDTGKVADLETRCQKN